MQTGPELSDFEGVWWLDRLIDDRHGRQTMRFRGRAVWTGVHASLTYVETGQIELPGRPSMQAERRYLWRSSGDGIAVLFDDGRPFHVIGPGLRPATHHDCAPDLYEVRYDFTAWPGWQSEWRVTGPRKDYTAVTRYEPE